MDILKSICYFKQARYAVIKHHDIVIISFFKLTRTLRR